MSALRRAAVCLCLGCALALAATGADANASPSPMVDKINKVRDAYGLPRMRYSRSLSRSSARFANHLAETQVFAHASRIRASNRFSQLGEILALMAGWEVRRSLTMAYWLRSWSHRAVLLNPSFRYVGAARAPGYFAGSPTLFWTVQFGRR